MIGTLCSSYLRNRNTHVLGDTPIHVLGGIPTRVLGGVPIVPILSFINSYDDTIIFATPTSGSDLNATRHAELP